VEAAVARSPGLLAGVDVGGTKIVAGVTAVDGRPLAFARGATPDSGAEAVAEQIARLVREALHAAGVAPRDVSAMGVAVPAVTDSSRRSVLWAPNVAGWDRETAVAEPLESALGIPVSLHYDGHAWVVGEWRFGAAQGARSVALVAVGTGIGGGLILDGRLIRGRIGVAGALGWWVPDWRLAGGRRARSDGWLESFASGPAVARAAHCATAQEAFARARQGDRRCQVAIAHAAQALGAAVAGLVSLTDPEVVVLAGGVVTGGGDLIVPRVEDVVRAEAQPRMAESVRVEVAALEDQAAWLGAAWLAGEEAQQGGA
jgi:glucokinase